MSEQTTMLERLGRVVESTIGEMSSYDYTLNYDHPSGMLGSEYLARAVIEALSSRPGIRTWAYRLPTARWKRHLLCFWHGWKVEN